MTSSSEPGLYLFIQFNWPANITKEIGQAAKNLHETVVASDWIHEAVAASGGLGSGPSSVWVFRLENYAALDRLLTDREDSVAQAYFNFFSNMDDMSEYIREGVLFT